ncbi:hypothetical protein ACIGCM_20880 [Pseudomonas sp. NPDC078700]|uniref:hypothetical protein n=1 Tax=Pseudomonas sp. NPDC078700 TaxID=3364424 RepID=UPI0037CB60F1
MSNIEELASRLEKAKEHNCLIEVISLRIQYMDIWLRVFFANTPHDEKRDQEFGRLLKQCFRLGLEKNLYDQILAFNKKRVQAIHGYLLGNISYDSLSTAIDASDGLAEKLVEFVICNSGEPVTQNFFNEPHNRGDCVYSIPALLHVLHARPVL